MAIPPGRDLKAMEPIIIDGVMFLPLGLDVAPNGNVWQSENLILKFDAPHPNKSNVLKREREIIFDLNLRGAVSVPRLISSGVLLGKEYAVMERIKPRPGGTNLDVLRACLELMNYGYAHGDLKCNNVIFDGQVAMMIDFDQTVYDPALGRMTAEDACTWADAHKSELPWRQCGSLREQLERFRFSDLARDPRLDLSKHPLNRREPQ